MPASKKQTHRTRTTMPPIRLRTVLPLAVLLVALYVLLPHLSSFNGSWAVLRTADAGLVLAALACIAGTNVAGAMVYYQLVTRPVPFLPMLLVQVASSFTNRLLPAGTGAMATCAAYLMRNRHTAAQAASVAVLNNLCGFIGNIILLSFILLASPVPLGVNLPDIVPAWARVAVAAAAVLGVIAAVSWPRARRALREGVREAWRVVRRPSHVLGALLSSMLLTLCFALALHASAHALDVQLTLLQSFYVLTIGVAAGAVTPLPGGLGGVEAGLVAALVSVGVPAGPALAVALLYRLVSYWAPIVPGYISFHIALKRRYI